LASTTAECQKAVNEPHHDTLGHPQAANQQTGGGPRPGIDQELPSNSVNACVEDFHEKHFANKSWSDTAKKLLWL
jgi:hypothetical protein